MRELKFKAVSDKAGEWVYFDLMRDADIDVTRPVNTRIARPWGRAFIDENEVKLETLCQFTGLTDSSGDDIYEGDELLCEGTELFSVIFYDGSFYAIELEDSSNSPFPLKQDRVHRLTLTGRNINDKKAETQIQARTA